MGLPLLILGEFSCLYRILHGSKKPSLQMQMLRLPLIKFDNAMGVIYVGFD